MELNRTTFGQIQTNGTGGTRLSSNVFGVDLGSLVNNLTTAKRVPITQKEILIGGNTAKITAYQTLQNLSTALNTATTKLRSPTVASGVEDTFSKKAAFAQSSTSTPPTSIATIIPDKNAELGSFSLKVNRLATIDVINASGTVASNTSTPLVANGTLSLNGTNIALTSGMTLDGIRDAINAVKTTTKVSASVIKVDDTHYKLNLQSTATGDAIDLSGSTAGVLSNLSLTASGATDTSLSAELTYNGVTVTRPNNKITDLVAGATIDLLTASPATTLSVDIKADSEAVKTGITQFVEAYNAVVDFVKQQNTINTDGSVPTTAVLFGSTALRTVYGQLQSAIASTVGGVTGLNNLREAGISLDTNNRLIIKDDKLDAAILEKSSEIKNLFAFKAAHTNNSFQTLSRPNELGDVVGKNITVSVAGTNALGSATTATLEYQGVTYTATIQNGIIRAPDNSPLKGFAFGYTGGVVNEGVDAPQTSTVVPTQGIADKISAFLETSLGTEGVVRRSITDLESKTTRVNKEIETINRQVELYRQRLEAQFASTQRNVALLQNIQNSVNATFNRSSN